MASVIHCTTVVIVDVAVEALPQLAVLPREPLTMPPPTTSPFAPVLQRRGELKHSGPGGLRRADLRATASTSGTGGRR